MIADKEDVCEQLTTTLVILSLITGSIYAVRGAYVLIGVSILILAAVISEFMLDNTSANLRSLLHIVVGSNTLWGLVVLCGILR